MTSGYEWLQRARISAGLLLSEYGNQQLLRAGRLAVLIWQFDLDGYYVMCALTMSEAEKVALRDRLQVGMLEPVRRSIEHESALLVVEDPAGGQDRLIPFNIDRAATEDEFIEDLYDLVGARPWPTVDPKIIHSANSIVHDARELAGAGP